MKPLHSDYISRHQFFTARKDAYETGSGILVDPYFVVELPPSACALAVTESNEVIFVEQYRHPIGQKILELPGGFIEEGEDPAQGVARELLEETGYAFKEFIQLGTTTANPVLLNNFTYMFLATGGVKKTEQTLDRNEEIEIVLKPLEEARQLLKENKIMQSMHALCMFYAFEKIAADH